MHSNTISSSLARGSVSEDKRSFSWFQNCLFSFVNSSVILKYE